MWNRTGSGARAGFGDVTDTLTEVGELQPAYELTVGTLDVDLSELTLADGSTTEVSASVGTRDLSFGVPPGARVEVNATVGIGQLDVLGSQRDGVSPALNIVSDPAGAATDAPRLVLDLTAGRLGRLPQ